MLYTNTAIDHRDGPRVAPTLINALTSFAGAAGIALLAPVAILLIGTPVVLAVRVLLEAIGWLFGAVVG
jgi:hypothetical protein